MDQPKSLVDLLGWSRISICNTANNRVSSIFNDGRLQPNLPETREIHSSIMQVSVKTDRTTDYWTKANHKKFIFSQIWNEIGIRRQQDDIYKLIWYNKTARKFC